VHRPVLTVAELETKIAELDSEIAPLAKRRSEFLRKKRNLVATFEAAKARKANELSSAKVKSLAAKHGTNVKGVQKIARELKCTPRTVYRKLREE
jgi:DNA invertase Pin-like site-specific DNA recombinase